MQRYDFIFKFPNISVFFLPCKMFKNNALDTGYLPAIHTPSHVRINALPVPPVRFKSYPRTIPQLPKQNPWKCPVLPRGKKTLNPVNVAGKRFYFLCFAYYINNIYIHTRNERKCTVCPAPLRVGCFALRVGCFCLVGAM